MERVKQKKLHIGYLLPDKEERANFFVRSALWLRHNRAQFDVTCYGAIDEAAARAFGMENWRAVAGMDPELAVQAIRYDEIDILVDLAQTRDKKRLAILRQKPAPIEACFVGDYRAKYPATLDYLLTDRYLHPADAEDGDIAPFRLPQTSFCYTSPEGLALSREWAFKKNGYVTFGCCWNLMLAADAFFSVWRALAEAVPTARFVLKSRVFGSGCARQEMRYRLKRLGFCLDRIEFAQQDEAAESRADILLDTFPCQGGLEVCDALYRGIPVIVMAGKQHDTRRGYGILKNIGLEECIGFTSEDYVKKAVVLAQNPYKLANLRKNLHGRMLKSPLMDLRRYVANVERAYRTMWKKQEERRRARIVREEILALCDTIAEGLSFVQSRVYGGGDALAGQVIEDVAAGIDRIGGTFAEARRADSFEAVLRQRELLRAAYAETSYDRAAEFAEALYAALAAYKEELKRRK